MCVCICVYVLCVYVCVCVCGGGGGINRPEVIVSKFISNLIGFYSSFYRHALIQNFLGANFTVHVYIYATFHAGLHADHVDLNLTQYLYMVNYSLFGTPSLFR